jgi:hypothetical protein
MQTRNPARKDLLGLAFVLFIAWQLTNISAAFGERSEVMTEDQMKAHFFELCDIHGKIVDQQPEIAGPGPKKKRVFYWDSYIVRASTVAYDVTRKKEYLDTCKKWSDMMVAHQKGMTPAGAYYMQYGRAPGEKEGNWFAADSSSIAMAVLATAVRCAGAEQQKYIESVKAFAKLVMDNYVRPSGGIANGFWPKSDKEFWCATGTSVRLPSSSIKRRATKNT